jgi:serine/threonine protein kinase
MVEQRSEGEARDALLLRVVRADGDEVLYLHDGFTIGRSGANDAVLQANGPEIDNRHARADLQSDGTYILTCICQGSTITPLSERGQAMTPLATLALKDGVRFRIGMAELECEGADEPAPQATSVGRVAQCPSCKKDMADAALGHHSCPHCNKDLFTYIADKRTTATETVVGTYGDYRVDQYIARGGMGIVFHGTSETVREAPEAAVKIIRDDLTKGSGSASTPGQIGSLKERFRKEIRAMESMMSLDSPYIVKLIDKGKVGDKYFFVMSWMNGLSLRDWLSRANATGSYIALHLACQWLEQLARGLKDIHSAGYIHRDITPENLLTDKVRRLRIADFGIAKAVEEVGKPGGLTTTPGALGTRQYMAPEQIRTPNNITAKVDQFALGLIALELLTGTLPASEKLDQALLRRRHVPDDLILRINQVVCRLLAKDPEERYAHCGLAADELETIAELARHARGSAAATSKTGTDKWETPAADGKGTGRNQRGSEKQLEPFDDYETADPQTITEPTSVAPIIVQPGKAPLAAAVGAAVFFFCIAAWLWYREPQSSLPVPPDPTLREELEKTKKNLGTALDRLKMLQDEIANRQQLPKKATPDTTQITGAAKTINDLKGQLGDIERQLSLERAKTRKVEEELKTEKLRTSHRRENRTSLVAGIEIGSRGVKGVVVRRGESAAAFVLEQRANVNSSLVGGTGKRFNEGSLRDTANAVDAVVENLLRSDAVEGLTEFYFVISSGVVSSVEGDPGELDRLRKYIAVSLPEAAKRVNDDLRTRGLRARPFPFNANELQGSDRIRAISTPSEEAEWTFRGLVAMRKWSEEEANETILIDVGSGNTKAGYCEFPDGRPDAIPFPQMVRAFDESNREIAIPGTVTLADQLNALRGRDKRERETFIAEKVIAPFQESVSRKPRLTNARRGVLAGGIVWAMTTIQFPNKIGEKCVVFSSDDIRQFRERLSASRGVFPNVPSEQSLSDGAKKELSRVRATFTPDQLFAGAELLNGISTACRMKEQSMRLEFYRDSLYAWIAFLASKSGRT